MNPHMTEQSAKTKKPDRAIKILISLLVWTRWVLALLLIPVFLSVLMPDVLPLHIGGGPDNPDGATVHIGMMVSDDMSRAAVAAEALNSVIYTVFGLYFISQLLGVLRNVRADNAFARDNGDRLRRIGYAGAAAQLCVYGVWIVFKLADALNMVAVKGMVIELSPAPWIGVLSAFALATVFREGTELKEEQDLTV